jgi:hypothetical protein
MIHRATRLCDVGLATRSSVSEPFLVPRNPTPPNFLVSRIPLQIITCILIKENTELTDSSCFLLQCGSKKGGLQGRLAPVTKKNILPLLGIETRSSTPQSSHYTDSGIPVPRAAEGKRSASWPGRFIPSATAPVLTSRDARRAT